MSTLPRVVIEAERTGGIVIEVLLVEAMIQLAGVETVQDWPRSRYVLLLMPNWRSVASDVSEGTMLSKPSLT